MTESQAYFLNINKSAGMTAHDVVARVRKIVGVKQVGHAGTLDPAAVGVLPVAVGKACRLLRYLPSDKVYLAEILLGVTTSTDDLEGEVIEKKDVDVKEADVAQALKSFVGPIEQKPPYFSAVHHNGQRLYDLARKGITPDDVKLRSVVVHELDLLQIALPVVQVRISCSAGTYIRSIARDLGEKLNVGGCLKALKREAAGSFRIENATDLEELARLYKAGELESIAIEPTSVLTMTEIAIDGDLAKRLSFGQAIPANLIDTGAIHDINRGSWQGDGELSSEPVVLSYKSAQDALLAVCRIASSETGLVLKPEVVIARSI